MSEARATERHAIRALLVAPDERVLLIELELPRGRRLWLTPGGGRVGDEPPERCLERELFEETGLRGFVRGPHVWHREHAFRWAGEWIHQVEDFYLVNTPRFEPRDDHLPPREVERELFRGFRWWAVDEIERSEARFVPRELGRELRRLFASGPPPEPIQVGV